MVRFLALPAVFFVNEMVLDEVRVGGERKCEGTLFDQSVKFLSIFHVDQWNVHQENNELIFRDQSQVILNELHLLFPKSTLVVPALTLGSADPFHIVEGQKVNGPVVERIVTGTKVALVRLIGELIVGCIKIDVVIPDDVVPRDSNHRDRLIVRFEDAQVIEDDIAKRNTKRSVVCIFFHDLFDDIVGHVLDFLNVARLCVPEHQRFELIGFLLLSQGKVDRLWQRPRRCDSWESGVRRTVWFVNVIELGELQRIDGGHPASRLDNKYDRILADSDLVPALCIGEDDFFPIRHACSLHSFFIGISLSVSVCVLVDETSAYGLRGIRIGTLGRNFMKCGGMCPSHRVGDSRETNQEKERLEISLRHRRVRGEREDEKGEAWPVIFSRLDSLDGGWPPVRAG